MQWCWRCLQQHLLQKPSDYTTFPTQKGPRRWATLCKREKASDTFYWCGFSAMFCSTSMALRKHHFPDYLPPAPWAGITLPGTSISFKPPPRPKRSFSAQPGPEFLLFDPAAEREGRITLLWWVSWHGCGCYKLICLRVSPLPHSEAGHVPTQGKAVSLQQSWCINVLLQNLAPENGVTKGQECNCLDVMGMKLLEDSLIILRNKINPLGAVYFWSCVTREVDRLHSPKT